MISKIRKAYRKWVGVPLAVNLALGAVGLADHVVMDSAAQKNLVDHLSLTSRSMLEYTIENAKDKYLIFINGDKVEISFRDEDLFY